MQDMPDILNMNDMMTLTTTHTMNAPTPKTRTFLAFDYGLKRIGVAVGQELTGTATALATVKATDGKPHWDAITRLIEQWKRDELVVGLPVNMDGTFHELSYKAQRELDGLPAKMEAREAEQNELQEQINLRAHFIDERLSSLEAEHQLKNQQQVQVKNAARKKGRKGQTADIDKIAAKVILESWLNQQHISTQQD